MAQDKDVMNCWILGSYGVFWAKLDLDFKWDSHCLIGWLTCLILAICTSVASAFSNWLGVYTVRVHVSRLIPCEWSIFRAYAYREYISLYALFLEVPEYQLPAVPYCQLAPNCYLETFTIHNSRKDINQLILDYSQSQGLTYPYSHVHAQDPNSLTASQERRLVREAEMITWRDFSGSRVSQGCYQFSALPSMPLWIQQDQLRIDIDKSLAI